MPRRTFGRMPQLTVYSASAGSGKTYTLTREYLRLALATPTDRGFSGVLALTFTNDAAAEMKTRIVAKLRELLPDSTPDAATTATDAYLDDLALDLAADGALPDHTTPEARRAEVQRRAAATFRRLLYDYADFAVSTIDSFGQRVVSTFARDLDLPAGFEVEMDTDSIVREAVGRLLDRVNRTETPDDTRLTALLRDFAEEQTAEDKSVYTLTDKLVEFSKHLFNDTALDAVRELTADGRDLAFYETLRAALTDRLRELEAPLRQLSEDATRLLDDGGLTDKDFYYGAVGLPAYLRNWAERLKPDGGPKTRTLETIEQDRWTTQTAPPAVKARVAAVSADLADLYAQLEERRPAAAAAHILLTAMLQHHLHLTLLGQVQTRVADICRERGLVLIGAFNRHIAKVVLSEPLPFLYERLGERYGHLLIDEFQDTSALQFNNLLPLIVESVGSGKRSLLVGDAKQAIYRWRGGELEQIVRLYQRDPRKLLERIRNPETLNLLVDRYMTLADNRINPQTLTENYRSARQLVEFNNAFFSAVRDAWGDEVPLLADLYEASFRQAVPPARQADPVAHIELLLVPRQSGARAYDAPTGTLTAAALPGYAATDTLDYATATLWRTRALIEQALADGFRLADVAVLCRSNKNSRAVARFLKLAGYPIISRDSLQLDFADSVNLVVSFLRVLHQPADGLARAGALLLLDKVVRQRQPDPVRLRQISALSDAKQPDATPFWAEVAALGFAGASPEKLTSLSLYEAAEQLLTAFDLLACAPAEADYLLRLLDITLDFSLRHGNNLGAFLDHWETRAHALSVNTPAEGRDAVTITTIHKSKGLAYGVVIVPFADWPMKPRNGTLLWGELAETELPLMLAPVPMPPVAVVNLNKGLEATVLAAQYRAEMERTFVENLNMLYVAFTRPRNRLYILTRQPDQADKEAGGLPDQMDKLLRAVLPLLPTTETTTTTTDGTRYVLSAGEPAPPARAASADPDARYGLRPAPTTPWAPRLQLRRRAADVLSFDADATRAASRERVNRLRNALRRLQSADDVTKLLRRLGAEGRVNAPEADQLQIDLRAVLTHPQLGPLFARPAAPPTEILCGAPTGSTPIAAPDPLPARVVEEPATGRVTLLDFPTDAADAEARAAFTAYAERYRALGYEDVRAWWFDLSNGGMRNEE